jgi:hypothetical protein
MIILIDSSTKRGDDSQALQDILRLLQRLTVSPLALPSPREQSSSSPDLTIEALELVLAKKKRTKRVLDIRSKLQKEDLCRTNKCCCDCHDTISILSRSWPLRMSCSAWLRNRCTKSSCIYAKKASFWMSLSPIGIPLAICIGLDVMRSAEGFSISPSLSFPNVVKRTSPGFELLWKIQRGTIKDWATAREQLLDLFETGRASPRDVDPDGESWLEVSSSVPSVSKLLNLRQKLLHTPMFGPSQHIQFELLRLLVRLGSQLNTERFVRAYKIQEDSYEDSESAFD